MVKRTRDLLAFAMAEAILGGCGRIVGASLGGNGHVRDEGAALSADNDTAVSSRLDIDFIPEVERAALRFLWCSDRIESGSLDPKSLVSVALNGNDSGQGGVGQSGFSPRVAGTDIGISVELMTLLSLVPGQLTSIRIATDGAASGELLTWSERAAKPGKLLANDDFVTLTVNGTAVVDLTANDIGPGASPIFVTAVNGTPLEDGESIVLPTGQTITLLADGTVEITGNGTLDNFSFTYTAAFGRGNAQQSVDAVVVVDTIPCFTRGTRIETERGARPVETLRRGDLVHTRDDGLQPIRWIGRRRVAACGELAPVRIAADTFGQHEALLVSPLHRVLVRNAMAELLFGTHEILVAARDLIDGRRVTRVEGGEVEYLHILFDDHQIVWSEGLETESFLPGPQTAHCFEADIVAEITALFPELDPVTGEGYGQAARPTLKRHEARLLVA